MYNSFISVTTVIDSLRDLTLLASFLPKAHQILKDNFSDFEIIVVNNAVGESIDAYITPLDPEIKHHVFLLNLSSATDKNHAVIAGLDRSNGDYTIIFELQFEQEPHRIIELFEHSRKGFDIVYLRAKERRIRASFRPFYTIFYYILRHYSDLKIDEKAHATRIISRRALNSLLRLRENLRYMKAIYAMVGYKTDYIEVDYPLVRIENSSFGESFKTSLVAITSFTTFLRSLLLRIFIFSFVFLLGVIVNALKVKFTGVDLFGNVGQAISGWTFLVILISVFFAITCLNLYIMSIYLSNIYAEIKQRPLYIIESIKRF